MKNFILSVVTTIFLLFITISCKKDKVPSPRFTDITSTTCRLISFRNGNYTAKYGANNKITEIYEHRSTNNSPTVVTLLHWRFQYENGLLRRVLSGKSMASDTNSSEAYTVHKFDYGTNGIEKIYDYYDGLEYRYDFKYERFGKPISMIQYANFDYTSATEDMKAVASFRYEYDKNGNIVKEYCTYLNSPVSYVTNYTYDNLPNSVKLFESCIFSQRSVAAMFSTNNVVENELVYNGSAPKKTIETKFDSEHKFVTEYNTLSGIVWDCK